MALLFPRPQIPASLSRFYRRARFFLYAVLVLVASNFLISVLFPTFTFPFDFRTPGSLRNTLTDPRTPAGTPQENGRIEKEGLVANASAYGQFSHAEVLATVGAESPLPETLGITLRRSYRSFLLPTGEEIGDFPEGGRFRVGDTYYELRDDTLFPFVSEAAFLSRYPVTFAQTAGPELLERYPISEKWLGYRPGSLLAYAQGVFVVMNEEEIRPVGSADIFLRLGYRFEDVIPASAEEIGVYEEGRIILLGAPHADGTLFVDQDSGTYYVIEGGRKRPIGDNEYRRFLLSQTTPIVASEKDAEKTVHCLATPAFFGRTLACQVSIETLAENLGNDYELRVEGREEPIELDRLSLSLVSEKSPASIRRLLSQVKVRFQIRFGLAQ